VRPDRQRVVELGRLYAGRVTIIQIARACGVSWSSCHDWLEAAGVAMKPGPTAKKTHRFDWQAVGLGVRSDTEIAHELGLHPSTVRGVRIGLGIARAPMRGKQKKEAPHGDHRVA